jgi:hypothetical protein
MELPRRLRKIFEQEASEKTEGKPSGFSVPLFPPVPFLFPQAQTILDNWRRKCPYGW